MIDRVTTELMHTELDGTNTAEQSERLRTRLAENADARAFFEDLKKLFHRLQSQPVLQPPPNLFQRIVDAIPFGSAYWSGKQESRNNIFFWLRGLAARPQLAYAATFALGLMIGASAFLFRGYDGKGGDGVSSSLDITHLSGTMGNVEQTENLAVIGGLDIDLETVSGTVRLLRSDTSLLADVLLDSERPIEWILAFDSTAMTVAGFQRLAGESGVFVTESAVSSRQVGRAHYVLRFDAGGDLSAPALELYDSGQLILKKKLTIESKN